MRFKRAAILVASVLAVCASAWLAYGFFVYSRNQFPDLDLPTAVPPPAGNVYNQYMQCIRDVRGARELGTLASLPQYGTLAHKAAVLAQNRDVLQRFHRLIGKPCGTTHQLAYPGDPVVDAYVTLARLIAAEGKSFEQKGDNDRALDVYLDGLTFTEDVMRGGTTLHFIQAYMAEAELFQAIPDVVSKVTPQMSLMAVKRMENLVKAQYSLKALFEQECRTAMEGWRKSVQLMRTRGFMLDIPRSAFEGQFLHASKNEMMKALSGYLHEWIQQAGEPYHKHQKVTYPTGPPGTPAGGVAEPVLLETAFSRYAYKDTRLRLIGASLLVERFRNMHGVYPTSLEGMGRTPLLVDPFSDKPLQYRSGNASYLLYSVGPNGVDDGGKRFREGRITREQVGDIGLRPTFVLP